MPTARRPFAAPDDYWNQRLMGGAGAPPMAASGGVPGIGRVAGMGPQFAVPGDPSGAPPPNPMMQNAALAAQMAQAQQAPVQGIPNVAAPTINAVGMGGLTTPMGGPSPGLTPADAVRAQMAQAAQANVPGAGRNMLRAGLAGAGIGAAFGGSPISTGVGAGIGLAGQYLKDRRKKNAAMMANGGAVKAEPVRMAMGGAAKVRKDFPKMPDPPKKNSFSNPLNGHATASTNSRGMGKALRGGTFKGSR